MLNLPDSLIYIIVFQIYPLVWRILHLAKVSVFTQDLLKNYHSLINLPQNLADTCINRRELFMRSAPNSRLAVCVPWPILSI